MSADLLPAKQEQNFFYFNFLFRETGIRIVPADWFGPYTVFSQSLVDEYERQKYLITFIIWPNFGSPYIKHLV